MCVIDCHLGWSDKQRRILTGDDKAEEYYVAARGFPFQETELPHYYLLRAATTEIFVKWKEMAQENPVVGVWRRPLFYGGWENSTSQDETVYNVQTNTLFVDLRIPATRELVFQLSASSIQSVDDMDKEQLRWFSRQHIFAGFSHLNEEKNGCYPYSCDRHHCIDWNFVGKGRSLPNKWWIEEHPQKKGSAWKEWAYATDDAGQHYYCERWERWEDKVFDLTETMPVVALRRVVTTEIDDGIIVIVGDHFNYCIAPKRKNSRLEVDEASDRKYGGSSLTGRVDAALDNDDLPTARALLSRIHGGHGYVSEGWKIDRAIEFWKEGTPLWTKEVLSVSGGSLDECTVTWKGEVWHVFESNLKQVAELQHLLFHSLK